MIESQWRERTNSKTSEPASSNAIVAWECIGCGRIEAPQPCLGVCQDRKVRLVYASDHEETIAKLDRVVNEIAALEGLVRRIALTTPHTGEWERSYRSLQEEARCALAALNAMRATAAEARIAAKESASEER